jgi:conjugal transfer/entry exclusion protein
MFSASSRHRLGAALALASTSMLIASPAHAQFVSTVFDPSNYSQNILTAARTLQQINNQITMLQNQAQSLINQAKNLTTVAFPELSAISQTITQVNQLMGQAQSIEFKVANLDSQFKTLFPTSFNQALTASQQVAARARAEQPDDGVPADHDGPGPDHREHRHRHQQSGEPLQPQPERAGLASGHPGDQPAPRPDRQAAAPDAEHDGRPVPRQALYEAGQTQATTDGQDATTKFLGSGTAYNP